MRYPGSKFELIGEPEAVFRAQHPETGQVFWEVHAQAANIATSDGGRRIHQYYASMKPGSMIVAVQGDHIEGRALLLPQERFTTTKVRRTGDRNTFELPGGGVEADETERKILEEAERELAEEAGIGARELMIIGDMMTHASTTDHNYTVLARDTYPLTEGATHEESEVIGGPLWFGWEDIETMQLLGGLATPDGPRRLVDSTQTSSSLWQAQIYLKREALQKPQTTIIDLGGGAVGGAGVIGSY